MAESKPVSDAELKAIESEVMRKQADALKETAEKTALEVESRVRKEMEAKIESDKLKEQLARHETELAKTKEETDMRLKVQQEAFEKRLQELEAQRKGVVTNQSPFDNKSNPNIRTVNGQEIDTEKLDLTEIEKQSAAEFKRAFNLPNFYFEKTGQIKR